MGALVLVLVAVFAISESELINSSNTADEVTMTENVAFAETDEGDIGQIFGTTNYQSEPIQVVVEEPIVQAQVNCYRTNELVRDLTIPYGQRSYIQADGTTCTPVE